MAAALEQANDAAMPDRPADHRRRGVLDQRRAKEHLRWVMPEPEDQLLDALARLHAAGQRHPGRPARGSSGCSAPTGCWRRSGTSRSAPARRPLEEPAEKFAADLAEALADDSDLTPEQRSARSGLANRQVTLR